MPTIAATRPAVNTPTQSPDPWADAMLAVEHQLCDLGLTPVYTRRDHRDGFEVTIAGLATFVEPDVSGLDVPEADDSAPPEDEDSAWTPALWSAALAEYHASERGRHNTAILNAENSAFIAEEDARAELVADSFVGAECTCHADRPAPADEFPARRYATEGLNPRKVGYIAGERVAS